MRVRIEDRSVTHLRHKSQRGAALVIGLLLLVVLTLLGVVGMNIATSELAVATNEQLRLRAFQAAENGIERAIPTLATDVGTDGDIVTVNAAADGSPRDGGGAALDRFETQSRFVAAFPIPKNASGDTFEAYHYEIASTGTTNRGARSAHVQGTYIVRRSDGSTFGGGGGPGGDTLFARP
jgi:type IV pilus assembly protein PilX